MVGDKVRAVATFIGVNGDVRLWVWHYILETGAEFLWGAIADAIEAQLAAAWAELADAIADNVIGDTLDILYWDAAEGRFDGVRQNVITDLVGNSVAEAMPGNVAPYVTFLTARPRSQGKKFLFDVSEAAAADGILTSGFIDGVAQFAFELATQVTGGGNTLSPGNFDPEEDTFWRWFDDVVSVGAFSGSQYRRLPGRGE